MHSTARSRLSAPAPVGAAHRLTRAVVGPLRHGDPREAGPDDDRGLHGIARGSGVSRARTIVRTMDAVLDSQLRSWSAGRLPITGVYDYLSESIDLIFGDVLRSRPMRPPWGGHGATPWRPHCRRRSGTGRRAAGEQSGGAGRVGRSRQVADRSRLCEAAGRLPPRLSARGVGADTRRVLAVADIPRSCGVLLALARIGAVQNPLIPILRDGRSRSSPARSAPSSSSVRRSGVASSTGQWRGSCRHRWPFRAGGRSARPRRCGIPAELGLPTGDPAALAPHAALDGPRWIYYSSGTTADPKGARHTDASIMASANALLDLMGLGEGDVYPIPWPITHIGGASVLAASLRGGVHLVLFEAFDPATTPVRMARYEPTVLGTAVPFFRAYLDAARRAEDEPLFPSLRFGCFGGAPVPAEIHDEMRAMFDVPLVGSWGLTEFPNATSAAPTDGLEIVSTSVGRAASGVSVRAVDPEGNVCGPGQEGELQLQGPQSFAGYVDATLDEAAIDASGWFHTGDLGTIDADGNVRITGASRTSSSVMRRTSRWSRWRSCSTATPMSPTRRCSEYPTAYRREGRGRRRSSRRTPGRADRHPRALPPPRPRRPEMPGAAGSRRRAAPERHGQGPQAGTAIASRRNAMRDAGPSATS